MREFTADLHIHTALSPCASNKLTPPAIVETALARGIGMIAICDHNSARNARAVMEAAGERLAVLAGMEIMTREEAHILGFFPTADEAESADGEVAARLPRTKADRPFPGEQRVMDRQGRIVGQERKMLSAATDMDLSETVALIHRHRGLAVAAHLNRPSFSVVSQFGLFPEDAPFDAIEVFVNGRFAGSEAEWARWGIPMLFSSDSHSLEEIGSVRTRIRMEEPTFEELALALRGAEERGCATSPCTCLT